MNLKPPRQVTVFIDDREQYPLLFPSSVVWYPYRTIGDSFLIQVEHERRHLDEGDYCLLEYPACCGIERKATLSELTRNLLTKDCTRATNALERFAAHFDHPYLLIDDNVQALFPLNPNKYQADGELVVDALLAETLRLNIPIICCGRARSTSSRRRVGTYLVHLMLNHALRNGDIHENLFDEL